MRNIMTSVWGVEMISTFIHLMSHKGLEFKLLEFVPWIICGEDFRFFWCVGYCPFFKNGFLIGFGPIFLNLGGTFVFGLGVNLQICQDSFWSENDRKTVLLPKYPNAKFLVQILNPKQFKSWIVCFRASPTTLIPILRKRKETRKVQRWWRA